MSESGDVCSPLLRLARVGGLTTVFVVMAFAFVGMGPFMRNMGRDINKFSNPQRMLPFVP